MQVLSCRDYTQFTQTEFLDQTDYPYTVCSSSKKYCFELREDSYHVETQLHFFHFSSRFAAIQCRKGNGKKQLISRNIFNPCFEFRTNLCTLTVLKKFLKKCISFTFFLTHQQTLCAIFFSHSGRSNQGFQIIHITVVVKKNYYFCLFLYQNFRRNLHTCI